MCKSRERLLLRICRTSSLIPFAAAIPLPFLNLLFPPAELSGLKAAFKSEEGFGSCISPLRPVFLWVRISHPIPFLFAFLRESSSSIESRSLCEAFDCRLKSPRMLPKILLLPELLSKEGFLSLCEGLSVCLGVTSLVLDVEAAAWLNLGFSITLMSGVESPSSLLSACCSAAPEEPGRNARSSSVILCGSTCLVNAD